MIDQTIIAEKNNYYCTTKIGKKPSPRTSPN